MKIRAKSYTQFILEAYIDDSGELQDFIPPSEEEYSSPIFDEAERIREFLEDEGAQRVYLNVDEGKVTITFYYFETKYKIELDLDSGEANLFAKSRRDGEILDIYSGPADSLFDLLLSGGLDFLR